MLKLPNLAFQPTEKSRAFDKSWRGAINRASILGFRAIGGGHAAASKVFSFLRLSPINKNSWADHTKKIEQGAKLLLEDDLNPAARHVKEFKFSNGEIGVGCSRIFNQLTSDNNDLYPTGKYSVFPPRPT